MAEMKLHFEKNDSRKWQLSAINGIYIGRLANITKTISHKPMRLFKMQDAAIQNALCDYAKCSMRPLSLTIKNRLQDKLRKGKLNGKIGRNVPQSQL